MDESSIILAIIGSREFNDYELLKCEILKFVDITNISKIISGGANGADKLGERFALEYDIEKLIFKPDWNKYGKSAGIIRNGDIINNSTHVIAFWKNNSPGTKNSIDRAKTNKKILKVVYV